MQAKKDDLILQLGKGLGVQVPILRVLSLLIEVADRPNAVVLETAILYTKTMLGMVEAPIDQVGIKTFANRIGDYLMASAVLPMYVKVKIVALAQALLAYSENPSKDRERAVLTALSTVEGIVKDVEREQYQCPFDSCTTGFCFA